MTKGKTDYLDEAIILAGGMGTRLREVSGDIPKPMMPVCGIPFLAHLLQQLLDAGVRRVVLSLGYRHGLITTFFGNSYKGLQLIYCIEYSPLGTGGALKHALASTKSENLLVLNGDSYFHVDIASFFAYHNKFAGHITIALKHLSDCLRYGKVSFENNRISSFKEKGSSGEGHINGGLYIINRHLLDEFPRKRAFSFEKDLLEQNLTDLVIVPYISDGYFIDIGTPDDYRKAQTDFADRVKTQQ